MNSTDWRDQGDGLLPSPRMTAMLDWLRLERAEQYDELRALIAAVPVGASLDNEREPAVAAYTRRLEELYETWDRAGQPDPRGHLARPSGWARRTYH